MANQYQGSLPDIALEKFGKSLEALLHQFAAEGLTHDAAAEKTGFKKGTIRIWCNRYGVKLNSSNNPAKNTKKPPDVKTHLQEGHINSRNFLYRKW